MILFLRFFFSLVLASMLLVTTWASTKSPLFGVPAEVAGHPWFIAALFDAYWGFLTFYVWVFYKQTCWLARGAWLVAILLLGNIAMAVYCLSELVDVDRNAPLSEVLTRRRTGPGWLGWGLAMTGVIVIVAAANNMG